MIARLRRLWRRLFPVPDDTQYPPSNKHPRSLRGWN